MACAEILDDIIARSGFAEHLEGDADGVRRASQNVAEMLSAASAFDADNGRRHLPEFLERVALVSDTDQVERGGGRVALMTLHTSKGLEYPVVFMAGMEEGLFPHMRSGDNASEIEEERRLCYVGMTRARRLLYLTNTLSRELYGRRARVAPVAVPARIEQDLIAPNRAGGGVRTVRPPLARSRTSIIPTARLPDDDGAGDDLAIGAHVMHQTFGRGVVRRREGRGDGAKVWVNFDRGGIKLLVLKFANLRAVAD
jgi:DNA helicase-2/ATP-dependent DNA helicase PcrA